MLVLRQDLEADLSNILQQHEQVRVGTPAAATMLVVLTLWILPPP